MVHQDGDVRIVGDGLGHQAGVHGGAGVSQLPTAVVAGGSQFLKGGTSFGTGCRSIGHTFDLGRFGTVVRKHQSGCVLLLNANAVAAVPTSAANEAEVTNADFREAALAASRMARRLIGATSFSLSTTSGAKSDYGAAFRQLCHSHGLSGMGARFAVNNALDRLNCACETLAALCAACLIYQSLLADCETVAAYDRARLQNRHKGKGTPT